jgi:hypothetical protein
MGTVIHIRDTVSRIFRRREADPHVVETAVLWHVTSQLARLPYVAQTRVMAHAEAMIEERHEMGLTVVDGTTRAPLDYAEGQD